MCSVPRDESKGERQTWIEIEENEGFSFSKGQNGCLENYFQ